MNQIKESCIDIAREILMSEYWIIRNDLFVQYDQTDKASTEYPEEPPFPTIDDIILFSKRIETYVLDSLDRVKYFKIAMTELIYQFNVKRDFLINRWHNLNDHNVPTEFYPTEFYLTFEVFVENAKKIEAYFLENNK